MPKFIVCVQQYVEEVAEVEVEAASAAEAAAKVDDNIHEFDPDWSDGDDTINQRVYAVKNEENEVVHSA